MPYTLRYDATRGLAGKARLTRALSLTASSKSIQSVLKASPYHHVIVSCLAVWRPDKAAWATQGLARITSAWTIVCWDEHNRYCALHSLR
jgi:hypothetical protein